MESHLFDYNFDLNVYSCKCVFNAWVVIYGFLND